MQWARRRYAPLLAWSLRQRTLGRRRRAGAGRACAALLATRLGSEFIPNLDEGDIAVHALRIPGHQPEPGGADAGDAGSAHQASSRKSSASSARSAPPRSRRSDAAVGRRHLRHAEAARRSGPIRASRKAKLVAELEAAVEAAARQQLRVHPADPDAHERADLGRARRRRGQGLRRRPRHAGRGRRAHRSAWCGRVPGAADVKLEQITGLPLLTVTPDRAGAGALRPQSGRRAGDRRAPRSAARWPGQLFEGDRRFDIVVRLPEAPAPGSGARSPTCRFRCAASGNADESSRGAQLDARRAAHGAAARSGDDRDRSSARTRSTARTASAASWSPPTCAAATSAASSRELRERVGGRGRGAGRLLDRLRRHVRAADLGQPAPRRSWCR